MIGYIEGEVIFSSESLALVVTASGLGYEISCLKNYTPSKKIKLYTTHICKEDSQKLYGFEHIEEKLFFEKLLKVKGVGPKSAHSLVANLGFRQVLFAIENKDKSILKKAPGVGLKAAAQILLDLESKVNELRTIALPMGKTDVSAKEISGLDDSSHLIIEDALEACVQLGFKKHNILPLAIDLMVQEEASSSEALLELLLKKL